MTIPCSFALPEEPLDARTGHARDLTPTGFFLAANVLYPRGTALALLLALPGRKHPVRLGGSVAWARASSPSGMYVRFSPAGDEVLRVERAATGAADGAKPPRGAEPLGS